MSQHKTGVESELLVRTKLESLGLKTRKPVPDKGVDIEAWCPDVPERIVRIQVKGRDPKTITSYRWFQIRIRKEELETAKNRGIPPEKVWQQQVDKIDFFVLEAIHFNESWVLSRDRTVELITLNEHVYGTRPDNIISYDNPLKAKQKEMNLDIVVDGEVLTTVFKDCLNNFEPILKFLKRDF